MYKLIFLTRSNYSTPIYSSNLLHLSNQPTSRTTGYITTMIDSIVHDKMQEFINKMGPLYQSPYEEESGNANFPLPKSPQQQVLIQSLWKAMNKFP